jgi:ATP-binding cassette subfamily B (MDR/TAP) protein 10
MPPLFFTHSRRLPLPRIYDAVKFARKRRAPFDNEYIIGLILHHKQRLVIAVSCLLFCTASNLAAPVLSGMLFETLVQQQPLEKYAKVGTKGR